MLPSVSPNEFFATHRYPPKSACTTNRMWSRIITLYAVSTSTGSNWPPVVWVVFDYRSINQFCRRQERAYLLAQFRPFRASNSWWTWGRPPSHIRAWPAGPHTRRPTGFARKSMEKLNRGRQDVKMNNSRAVSRQYHLQCTISMTRLLTVGGTPLEAMHR